MSLQIILWSSVSKLNCIGCAVAKVVLCVDPSKVAQKPCVETDIFSGRLDFPYKTIEAVLLDTVVGNDTCGGQSLYTYTLQYELADVLGVPLIAKNIKGVFCRNCVSTYIDEKAGNDVTLTLVPPTEEDPGIVTLTNQHGCQYSFELVGEGTQGPQGVQGASGVEGAQGASGTAGAQGSQGATGSGSQGAQGAQGSGGGIGSQGSQGSQGMTGSGAQGAQGSQGPGGGAQGSQGATGVQGSQGSQGATGAGAQGSQGAQGSVGVQGSQGATGTGSQGDAGAQGAQGSQGDAGVAGSQGSQGATGTAGSQGSQGAAGATGSQGSQGATGTTGSQGAQGTSGAAGSQGAQGDAGAGGSQGSQGAAGAGGAQGAQGSAGAGGAQGSQGAAGAGGSQGSQGAAGAGGAQGAQGATGAGSQGAQGAAGAGGAQGSQGAAGSGAQGSQGAAGAPGAQGSQGAIGIGVAGTNTFGASNLGNLSGTTGVVSGSGLQFIYVGGSNITLSQSIGVGSLAGTISIIGASVSSLIEYNNIFYRNNLENIVSLTAVTQTPLFTPFTVRGSLIWNDMRIEVSRAANGSNLMTFHAAIYTYVNSTQISRLASVSNSYSNTATVSVSGLRLFRITGMETIGSTLSPGNYVMMLYASAANTISMNYILRGVIQSPLVGMIVPGANSAISATSALSSIPLQQFMGLYTNTTASPPASVTLSDLQLWTSNNPVWFGLYST